MLLFCVTAVAVGAPGDAELRGVNALRAAAGLAALRTEPRLADAARRHAAYLDRHREPGKTVQGVSAHAQQPGRAGFVAATPAERALAAGYPHREVLENVSMGYASADAALDGLMSAIYHRLTFLDLLADELGVAVGERSRVFLLGRGDRSAMCNTTPPEAMLQSPLDCLGTPMRRDYYARLCAALPRHARFRPAHAISCPDGTRLDAAYMQAVCGDPPPAARFSGRGRYVTPCGNARRLDADWFLGLCSGREPAALAAGDGSYYMICDDRERVDAAWFETLCRDLPPAAQFSGTLRYRRPCSQPLDVRVDYLDAQDAARLEGTPEVVVWPPDDARDVPPAFFVEEPDPLPDRDVSGYPLSLQFNPGRVERVELRGFRLYRDEDDAADVTVATRLLDASSDPNRILTAFEFALFPLERLAWGQSYRAVADLSIDGRPRRMAWRFRTREPGAPLLVAGRDTQAFVVQSGADYWLYLPPTGQAAQTAQSVRTQHRQGNRVTIEAVDANTLSIRLDARHCDRVRMRFDSGREVDLIPRGCPG
ncbi:MAG: CAP domain-containing protein [Gammaproteobacteria bacterium]|nr:CAP domain-containing protein [Gammaproteobacteria bacterium]